MADYNEQTVTGRSWQRCHQITIANPHQATPSVTFFEEVLTLIGEKAIRTSSLALSVPFDPTKQIAMRNTETGEPTGSTITMGEVYAILYSAYFQFALERDAAAAQPDSTTNQ